MGSVRLAARRSARPGPRAAGWAGPLAVALAVGAVAALAARSGAQAPEPLAVDAALLARPGATLARATQALADGETARADALLAALSDRHPVIADHAELLRMRWRVAAGRHDEAIELRTRWPGDSPLAPAFHALLGDAYAARGDEPAARAAWTLAIEEEDEEDRVASLRLAVGDSHARSGERAAAAQWWLRVWRSHPLSEAAERAAERLTEEEARRGRPLRDADDHRQRGDALYRHRRNEAALAAYETALASEGWRGAGRRRAQRQRAETLFRLRRYREAAVAYAQLPPSEDVAIAHARSLARSARVPQAVVELERVAERSRTRQGARAHLLAALLLEDEGGDGPARAEAHYRTLLRRFGRTSYAAAARWRLGWAAYRAGRYEQAIAFFERLGADGLDGLRARYWHARAAERAGREEAGAELAAIAREFPLSYYGWRAQTRVAPGGPVRSDPAAVRIEDLRGTAALAPGDLARAEILLEAGLVAEVREELDRLFLRARGLDDRLALAALYADAGDFHRAQRLVLDAYLEPLARGPLPAAIELWWHAWPLPYANAVLDSTSDGTRVPPQLVYAVMREESGFRPAVVSVSGARGLLQLMPETAERVAERLGLPAYPEEALFEPPVNIRLGSAYLEQLLVRFSGRTSAAVGGYNAGPGAVARWLAEQPGEDDEWVEAIPYNQTRQYVKRVLRSLHAYRVLY